MFVLDALQHLQLVRDHALVTLDIFLEDNLDRDFLAIDLGLSNDTVCACAQGAAESVGGFLVVAAWLAVQAVDHTRD